MSQLVRRRPSPSMIVAIAAVIIASAGSAVAATVITTKQIRNGTIQLVDVSKATRDALQGKRGPQGPVGPAGAPGATGATGASGAAGSAIAYASVAANGDIDRDASSGIALLSTGTGMYCLDRTGGTVKNFVATVNKRGVSGTSYEAIGTTVASEIAAASCPSGTDLLVQTSVSSSRADLAFNLAIIA